MPLSRMVPNTDSPARGDHRLGIGHIDIVNYASDGLLWLSPATSVPSFWKTAWRVKEMVTSDKFSCCMENCSIIAWQVEPLHFWQASNDGDSMMASKGSGILRRTDTERPFINFRHIRLWPVGRTWRSPMVSTVAYFFFAFNEEPIIIRHCHDTSEFLHFLSPALST